MNWCGGVTEYRRIVALAAAYDKMVIPHGSSVFSYHCQARRGSRRASSVRSPPRMSASSAGAQYAFPQTPMAEFLVMAPEADHITPLFGSLFTDEPVPKACSRAAVQPCPRTSRSPILLCGACASRTAGLTCPTVGWGVTLNKEP